MPSSTQTRGRVVVGTDGSLPAQTAVDWAATKAEQYGTPLLIMSVMPQFPIPKRAHLFSAMATGDYHAHLHRRGEHKLGLERDRVLATHPNLTVETALVEDEASFALARASRDARLVVIGARGESAPARVRVLGGTSDAVATHAHGPVAIIPENVDTARRGPVVVGVDDAPEALEAIRIAIGEAQALGVPLVAVHAWDIGPWLEPPYKGTLPDVGTVESALDTMIDEILAPHLADAPDVVVEKRILAGNPAVALVKASEEASLVVVGSRGRGGFAGLLLGSTSRELVRQAHCPVIVTRAPDA